MRYGDSLDTDEKKSLRDIINRAVTPDIEHKYADLVVFVVSKDEFEIIMNMFDEKIQLTTDLNNFLNMRP